MQTTLPEVVAWKASLKTETPDIAVQMQML
jgi:hypothetical protein